jgi:hypothetical protein
VAKANVLKLRESSQFRLTATKPGYGIWTATTTLANESKVEIILKKKEETVDIYVAGYDGANAIYWKNGVPVRFPQHGGYANYTTDIYVFNEDVYVTGRTLEAPLYWKNDEKQFLSMPAGAIWGETHGVFVRENEVHVCGHYVESDHGIPSYWKNGVRTDLPIPHPFTNGITTGISVDGSDVYISGYVQTWNTSLPTAALWKNGSYVPLEIPAGYKVSMTKGVKASAGHVYASGYIAVAPYETSNRTVRAVYWKDGELQFVEQSTPSSAGSLDIEGNDVYVPYNTISNGTSVQMKYWKNGEKVVVDESVLLFSYDLTVSGGDVYMAGTYKKQSTDDAIATYWVNGERVPLQSEKESQAVACFVVRRQ